MKMARREALPACGPVWKTGPPRRWLPLSKSALRTEVSLTGSADSLPSGKSAGKLGNLPQLSMAYGALKNVVIFIAPAEKSLYM
jgi:hypothetical protein